VAQDQTRQVPSFGQFALFHSARMGLVLIFAVLAGLLNGELVLSGIVFAIWLVALVVWLRLRGAARPKPLLRR
jgi:high-affinity Fe2+/Pb2+ permease